MGKVAKTTDARFTKTVTATDLSNRSGDVLLDSEKGPVGVLRHGKPRYVILTIDMYEKLRRAGDTRRVYRTSEIPPDMLDAMLKAMKEHVEQHDGD
jgi:prevent-host-death family protein